ncbi:MAG: class I fructose-bisphosphate aldolase [Alphaproteobacteria bacterium]|nr:class I fructose-bisphosphate aldolase [Alphaproteobacteria bacterium]
MKKISGILNNYSDNPGVKNSIARMFLHGHLAGTGKLLFLSSLKSVEESPVSTFFENKHGYDPLYHFQLAVDGKVSAIVGNIGTIEAGASIFAGRVPMILQINSADSINVSKLSPSQAVLASVDDALRLGCCGISFTMFFGSDRSIDMMSDFAQIAEEAKSAGLAVMIRVCPRGGAVSKTGENALDIVSYSAHVAASIGAHIINVTLPYDLIEMHKHKKAYKNMDTANTANRVGHIVENAFNGRRIVVVSHSTTQNDSEIIDEARAIRDGGAHGSMFQFSVFKRELDAAITIMDKVGNIYSVDN